MFDFNLFSLTTLGQLITLALIFAIAWISQFILGRIFMALEMRLRHVPWARHLPAITLSVLPPLLGWWLTWLAINTFETFDWTTILLSWVPPLFTLWFFYRLADTLIRVNSRAAQAQVWRKKVLLPIAIFAAFLYGFGLLDDFLNLGSLADENLQNITVGTVLAGLAIIAFFIFLSRVVFRFLEEGFLPEVGFEPGLTHAVSTLMAYVILIVGAVAGLAVTGVNLTTLTVIAGGLSIGLGFGLQQIVSNFVSGFILMFDRSISPGDVIEISDTVGAVQNIGIRSIIIKTATNREVIIPNSHFLSDMMTNLTRTDRIVRVDIKVGVSYDADPLEVEQALLEAAQHPQVLEEPVPSVQFRDFGDSSLDFALLVWINDPMRIPALTSDLRYRIWDSLKRRNIEIPFPQRDLHIRSGIMWPSGNANSHPVEENLNQGQE
ncbi:MAG: mechanosensitive ion channel [Anaerolineae bacterium]|nr:mechanosensitive ion channel [Anaerolineae bacterium]